MNKKKGTKLVISKSTKIEDPRSNYHKWLIEENLLYNEESVRAHKDFINAFSGFLSLYNPDYHYNETYLNSYYSNFINGSEKLKGRVNLLENLIVESEFLDFVRRFDKMYSTPTKKSLKLLVINIDDVVTCTISTYSSENISNLEPKNIPFIKIISNPSLEKLDNNKLNISYRLRYRDLIESNSKIIEGEDKEIFHLYENVYQNIKEKGTDNSKFSLFNKLF